MAVGFSEEGDVRVVVPQNGGETRDTCDDAAPRGNGQWGGLPLRACVPDRQVGP